MNGKRLLLDTNAVIALLKGNQAVMDYVDAADWIGICVISQIEFLCFAHLTAADRQLFAKFISQVEVVGLDPKDKRLIDQIVAIRQSSGAKLPDAMIVAAAFCHDACLVSADRKLASIEHLQVLTFPS